MDTNLRPHVQNQLSKFNELWLETCNSWPPPGFTVDKHTRKNWGLIAVPETEAWEHVCEIIDVFSKSWPWNIAYTLPQLHVTIASLGTPTSWKGNEEILDAILRQVAVHEDPIEVDFHGLNLLRNTIIVQVVDKQDKFRKLVGHITELVTEAGLDKNLKIGIHDRLWWTSAIRLYQPIPDDILNFVSSFKNIFLGSTIIDSIKLIENNKTHDPAEVKIIDSYKFSEKKQMSIANKKSNKLNVCLYMTTSANGFIATTDERTPWSEEVWDSYHKIVSRFKNMIVGRRTYEIMKEVNEFETLKNPTTLVVTSDKSVSNYDNILFVSSPEQALQELAERNFATALVAGGSKLNQAFLEKGLVNEIYLDVEPFIFGNGLPLFSPSEKELSLSLQNINRIGKNTVQLYYRCID